jgi:hypothetical protein
MSDRLVAMYDRLYGRCPIARQFFVPEERKFHPAAAEKVPRLERVRKTKTAPRNPDATRRPVGSRALQTRFMIVNDCKQIIRVLCDDPKNISRIEPVKRKLLRIRFSVPRSELLPV